MATPTISIKMTNTKWVDNLKAKFKKASEPDFKDFRDEALDILKDTALSKIQHQYVGNQVGGYYEQLDVVVKKTGFDLVANSDHSQAVEFGTPKTTGHPLVFRGKYPSTKISDAKLASIAGIDSGKPAKKAKIPTRQRAYAIFKAARKVESVNHANHGDLMKAVHLADKKFTAELIEGRKGMQVVYSQDVEANYKAAKKLLKVGPTKYKYGIYTVFSENVSGYRGLGVLRTAAKEIAKRAKVYMRKQAVMTVTGKRGGGFNIGLN